MKPYSKTENCSVSNLTLTETQKAYLAGFLETKRFTPQDKYGSITTTWGWQQEEIVRKVARLVGAKIHTMQGSTFGETFAYADRPAVYTDKKTARLYFYWKGRNAQRIVKLIYQYLSQGTRIRFKPLLQKKYLTRQEVGAMGGKANARKENRKWGKYRDETPAEFRARQIRTGSYRVPRAV